MLHQGPQGFRDFAGGINDICATDKLKGSDLVKINLPRRAAIAAEICTIVGVLIDGYLHFGQLHLLMIHEFTREISFPALNINVSGVSNIIAIIGTDTAGEHHAVDCGTPCRDIKRVAVATVFEGYLGGLLGVRRTPGLSTGRTTRGPV